MGVAINHNSRSRSYQPIDRLQRTFADNAMRSAIKTLNEAMNDASSRSCQRKLSQAVRHIMTAQQALPNG